TLSSSIRRSDGVHIRVISDTPPSSSAITVPPTLEDAYLYCIAAHAPLHAETAATQNTTQRMEV
ncbi:MAG TPA: hypothetical protein VKT25_07370, partial [Ktedonobacteraceae bacterium]|nr:hypothetical protein [Ktedonobacteraceae bacterium]